MPDHISAPGSAAGIPGTAVPQVILVPLKSALIAGHAHTLPVLVRVQAPDAGPARTSARRPCHLSLVLDRSGSMSGQPLLEAVRCARHMVDQLLPTDVASLVVFDDRVRVLVPAQPVGDRQALQRALAGIHCGGSTDLHGGWDAGVQSLLPEAQSAAIARAIVLTDGNANCGELTDPQRIAGHCAAAAARGVTTSTYGLGRDFNEALMVAMARAGGGNHYYGDTAADLFEPFAEEFDLISHLYARQVRLSLATCPGVGVKMLNDYPVAGGAHTPVITLPDLPFGAEAWVMLELAIPAGFVPPPGAPLLRADVTGVSLERAPIAFPDATLALEGVPPQVWEALAADPLARARLAEVEASRLIEHARALVDCGDWAAVRALIESARRRFGDQPWVQGVLGQLEEIAGRRDEAHFGKEAMYSALKMRSRLAAKDEAVEVFAMAHEASVPRFLRRDAAQGRKSGRRPSQ